MIRYRRYIPVTYIQFFIIFMFLRIKPINSFFQTIKPTLFRSLTGSSQGESAAIRSAETMHRTQALDAIIIFVLISSHNTIIIIREQPPTIGADSLMVLLNKVGTAFGIAAARQLHHLGPLVEATEFVALGGIIVVAVAFNLGIVVLVIFAEHHLTDIQIFRHHGNRISLIFRINRYVVITAAITRIRESFVSILTYTPSTSQCLGVVKRHIFTAAGLLRDARGRGLRATAGFCRAAGRFCTATGFFFA